MTVALLLKTVLLGVSVVAQRVKNTNSVYEDVDLILGFIQWVKDPALLGAVV